MIKCFIICWKDVAWLFKIYFFSTEAARAIWTLSFDKQNKKEMIEKKTWNVIETLEKKSQSSDEEVKEISKQALWTIKDQQNSCKYIII